MSPSLTAPIPKKLTQTTAGYLRHHHFNNRIYLLSPSQGILAQSFLSSSLRQKLPLPLGDEFELEEGTKVEFDGFVAEVGTLEFESATVRPLPRAETRGNAADLRSRRTSQPSTPAPNSPPTRLPGATRLTPPHAPHAPRPAPVLRVGSSVLRSSRPPRERSSALPA